MNVLLFLWIVFCSLTDIVDAMDHRNNIGYDQYHSGHQPARKEFFPPFSEVKDSIQQQTMPHFKNQSASYKNYDYEYFDQNPAYRKRKLSTQSDIGPMTNRLMDDALNDSSKVIFVKRKKRHRQLSSSTQISQHDFFYNKLRDNSLNQNSHNTFSQKDVDDTIDVLKSHSSFVTEIVDQPSEKSLTPTVLIESQSSERKNPVICEASSSSFSTSVLTKSQKNNLQNKKKSENKIEEKFTDKFKLFLRKTSEIQEKIDQQTEKFLNDQQPNNLGNSRLEIDKSLFELRRDIQSTEDFLIKELNELDWYIFQLITKYSKCQNQKELLGAKQIIPTMKNMIIENFFTWINRIIKVDHQVQNLLETLLEIANDYQIDNSIFCSHFIGISREISEFKQKITDIISNLFEGLNVWNKDLDKNILIITAQDKQMIWINYKENYKKRKKS